MSSSLIRPEPRRIIPKSVVDALIADADRQISALEQQAERAVAAADVADARLADLGVDERGSAWATVQLERFVRSLREDVAVESVAVLAEAKVRAQAIIDEASYEVAVAHDHTEPSELEDIERGLFPPLARAVTPVEAAVPVEMESELVEQPVMAPESPLAPGLPMTVPPFTSPAAVNAPPSEIVAMPPVRHVAEPVVGLVAPAHASTDDPVFAAITPESLGSLDADAAQPDTEFWSDPAEKRRRFARPNRRTVAMQGIALALLSAAVVVRFG